MKKFLSCFGVKDSSNEPLRRKMVIVGDGECGKTCLVTRMSTGQFMDNGYLPTVFETDVVNVSTGEEEVELVIYDTAGQEDYDRLRPLSYNDVDVVIICFSLADPDSLVNVAENWSPEIRYFCGDAPVILVGNKKDLRDVSEPSSKSSKQSLTTAGGKDESTPCETKNNQGSNTDVLSGKDNMETIVESPFMKYSSLRPQFRPHAPVKHSEGALMAKRIGAMAYFETSALTGENVEDALLATTKAAVLGKRRSKKFRPFTDTLKSWRSLNKLSKK